MIPKERILVHACCASCSSYVLEKLASRFRVKAFYYNPNIQPGEEYRLRLEEMSIVCGRLGIPIIEGRYDTEAWTEAVAPFAHLPEKSERCRVCYRFRLEETASKAREESIDLFTTTLSVSPHKIYRWIAEEGKAAGGLHGVEFLDEDFKKKGGFQESCRLSQEIGLTRQDYCGCLYSLAESEKRKGGKQGDEDGS
jgi:predicted adenine nucleotide alpha hydrolase (AANH) superfamily ATPase